MNPEEASLRSELEALLQCETLLAELLSELITLPADQTDQEIDGVLKKVIDQLDLDGVAV